MQTAAAYIRVSTDDQTEYSPAAQLKAIKAYCEKNAYLLDPAYIYVDEGYSGRKAEKRPAFMKMIGTAKKKPAPFRVILCHKFDRFARNREDSVVYKSLLHKECGVKVISITESIENDKMCIIMESMLEAMAEYYSINLGEEVKKGMTEKAGRGEPCSIPPFGYKLVDKKLVIVPQEAEIIRKIYGEFIAGGSYFEIAHKLNAMGIQTHRGHAFENRTISYILQNPVYIGYIRWTPTGKIRRNFHSPDSMVVRGTHEAIVDATVFQIAANRIKEIRASCRPYQKPDVKPAHWLKGLVRCSRCGHVLVNSNGYYVCNGYVHGTCTCRNSIRKDRLDALVLRSIQKDLSMPQIMNIQHMASDNPAKQLDEQIAEWKLQLDRCQAAYAKGIDTLEEYAHNKTRITREIAQLNRRRPAEQPSPCPQYILDGMRELLKQDDNRREFAKKIIQEIVWDRESKTLRIVYFTS